MGLRQTAAPSDEPLTLEEAKLYLRVDADLTNDDDLITALIIAAREQAEKVTGRQLVTATWLLTLESFYDRAWCYCDPCLGDVVQIPKPPLDGDSVEVTYIDAGGDEQTLDAADYIVDAARQPGIITPVYGLVWPVTRRHPAAVTVSFDAGFGSDADVPEGIKIAMKLMLDDWYNGRTGAKGAIGDVPPVAENLLRGYWHGAYA